MTQEANNLTVVLQQYSFKFCKRTKTKCSREHNNPKTHQHHRRRHHSTASLLFNILISTYLICLFNRQSTSRTTFAFVDAQQDPPPVLHMSWDVSENAPNGTYVGRILSNDGQPPKIIYSETPALEIALNAAFSINTLTGDITTSGPLDRELRESYSFVALFEQSKNHEAKCTIKVRDVNDNAPYFVTNETIYVVEVPENLVARFPLPLVVDPDASPNAIREIRILSNNAPKGLFTAVSHDAPVRSSLGQNSNLGLPNEDSSSQFTSGIDNPALARELAQQEFSLMITQPVTSGNADGLQSSTSANSNSNSAPNSDTPQRYQADLEVVRPLDRENQSSYSLVLEALDGGTPPKISTLKVTVHVLDMNDNDPVFGTKLHKLSVKEDTPKNTIITSVQAHDSDMGSNGVISYFYKRHQSTSQPSSNVINTNSSDNNEVSATSSARLTATSTAANSNSNNINNNNNKQRLQQQQQIMATNGKFAAQQRTSTASADAYDNSPGQLMSNSLAQQDLTFPYKARPQTSYPPDQYFDVDIVKGEVMLIRELDFETEQVHEFVIEARDHGKPPRSSNITVRITVLDVPDDPPVRQHDESRRLGSNNLNGIQSETSRADASAMARDNVDSLTQQNFNLQNFNLLNWFAQMNSSLLFVIVLGLTVVFAFSVCFVKTKSRQPESDYNDTANLNPNNGASKSSPNHSTNNIDHSSMGPDGLHSAYRHHDHHRYPNGPYSGGGGGGGLNGSTGPPSGKISRYNYIADSSNLYHNPYPSQQRSRHHSSTSHHMVPDSPIEHQMAHGGSRGGTMNLHNHHHHHLLAAHTSPGHHSMDNHHHNHHQFANANHTTSSLTYAHHHSRAALLHQAHHHQSSHQLSSVHQAAIAAAAAAAAAGSGGSPGAGVVGGGHNKGGTMNSHHSNAHPPSGSPIPPTPNTTHSSGLPMNVHDHVGGHHGNLPSLPLPGHHHGHHPGHLGHQHHHQQQSTQMPTTPCGQAGPTGSVFAWPPTTAQGGPGSTIGCFPSSAGLPNVAANVAATSGSLDSCGTPGAPTTSAGQPLDRWFDLGVSSQLVYGHDWCGSYNWDYLADWTPDYTNLMPLIRSEAPGAF